MFPLSSLFWLNKIKTTTTNSIWIWFQVPISSTASDIVDINKSKHSHRRVISHRPPRWDAVSRNHTGLTEFYSHTLSTLCYLPANICSKLCTQKYSTVRQNGTPRLVAQTRWDHWWGQYICITGDFKCHLSNFVANVQTSNSLVSCMRFHSVKQGCNTNSSSTRST